jgi:tripartite-type tricarboxylate transporter receptor subunit TctC
MKLTRRTVLQRSVGAATFLAMPRLAWAQTYPTRPIRIIVGYAAGGAGDITARSIAQWLSDRLGQPFVIENRPGAGTNIATESVVRAPADGYTLLVASAANAINATLYEKLGFDFIRDVAAVAGIIHVPLVMVVHPSFSARTVPEFIAYAKANPGKISMASAGTGSAPHVAGELLKMMAGIDMVHVPYRGGTPATTDLLSGQVQVYFGTTTAMAPHIAAGKLRALAVTTATRSQVLAEIPTLAEFVPGYEASEWFGLVAPRATSAEIVDRLNKEINAGLADPKVKSRFAEQGATVLVGSPADFGQLIATEIRKWADVIKFSGAKPD